MKKIICIAIFWNIATVLVAQGSYSKMSICDRLKQVNRIQIFIPESPNNLDAYIYNNFAEYLFQLGVPTIKFTQATFKDETINLETVRGFNKYVYDNCLNYLEDKQELGISIAYMYSVGYYVSGTTLFITFIDIDGNEWRYKMSLPMNSSKKYIKALRKNICTHIE